MTRPEWLAEEYANLYSDDVQAKYHKDLAAVGYIAGYKQAIEDAVLTVDGLHCFIYPEDTNKEKYRAINKVVDAAQGKIRALLTDEADG